VLLILWAVRGPRSIPSPTPTCASPAVDVRDVGRRLLDALLQGRSPIRLAALSLCEVHAVVSGPRATARFHQATSAGASNLR
jgi:hypothetical protein